MLDSVAMNNASEVGGVLWCVGGVCVWCVSGV